MKQLLLALCTVLIFTACKNNTTTAEKSTTENVISEVKEAITNEGLKAAIYQTETVMPGGMGTTSSTVSFDDYGKKSHTVVVAAISFGGRSMNTTTNSLRLDGYVYSWQTGNKSGMKFKIDESKFDPNNLDFSSMNEKLRKELNYKDEGTETVDGKECRVSSFNSEQMKGKIWMWKQVPIKMEMSVVGKSVTTTLKRLDENPSFSAETFALPSDVEFKEMTMPSTAAN
ncbi:MAG: hypothetical protein IT275_04855 [Chitinophagales bacterium]|nr:hypothetical protein [Chitinophagales bacterium]HMV15198.1 hypothetical protein [Chitinophagales bacterium]HMW13341.1 hypothetical protein [Chitinophagales bacterium]HMX60399.1 hypothetical protein [Chitinophagales bacterium]HMY22420.1 hypothetical protein [Chitinophagales bacterium]